MASFGQLAREVVDRLRDAGARNALSLEAVAQRAGLSKRTLEKWKSGKIETPPDETVLRVLCALGVAREAALIEIYQLKQSAETTDPSVVLSRPPINEIGASKIQPTLTGPPEVQRLSHYARRTLDLVGRDLEWKALRRFVDVGESFAWLQLAGVAGQGKSRLALELMLTVKREGWLAGFLSDEDIAEFDQKWREWQPSRPTLLIVDYVVGRDLSVGRVLRRLARRADEFRLPVRLLLLERQRWDRGVALNALNDDGGETGGRADWFIALTDRYDGADWALSRTRFEAGVIELTELNSEDLVSIVRRIAELQGCELALDDIRIGAELARIDAHGRPLYAYFLGQTLAREPERRGWTLEELLDAVLRREWAQRWPAAFDGSAPEIGEDHAAARLSVIATMCDGIDWKFSRELGAPFDVGPKDRRRALVMTDGPLARGVPANNIPALQPDILGEWFVIRSIRDGLPIEILCEGAWKIGPKGMARFLERLAQDFPKHVVTSALLGCLPVYDEAADVYAGVAASIIRYLHRARAGIPTAVIDMLERAAAAGNARAMATLGSCFAIGVGVEKNWDRAVEWSREGAAAGDSGAMANLGFAYQTGIGVDKDLPIAIEWYSKSAMLGNSSAMARLGSCYQSGEGVEKDVSIALHWYRKAAAVGNGGAMASLGVCFAFGDGVERDLAEALAWYRKGADAGNGWAMTNLGYCYQSGNGVEKNPARAVEWYRKGAAVGDGGAMVNLAGCYGNGSGVEKDLHEAVRWYRLSAATGNGWAMTHLGFCYQNGNGVEKDERLAVEWYRKGASVGDSWAMTYLGACYQSGIGVPMDREVAAEWYRRGASLGNPLAESLLFMPYVGLPIEWHSVMGEHSYSGQLRQNEDR